MSDAAQNHLQAVEDSYVLENQIGYLLRLAMQRHMSIFLSKMVDGLTQGQFAALAMLYREGACSQNELGRLISFDASTINGIVGRMKERGLVTVTKSLVDKRSRVLNLTEKGREVVERAIPTAQSTTGETLLPLTAKEAVMVISALKKLT